MNIDNFLSIYTEKIKTEVEKSINVKYANPGFYHNKTYGTAYISFCLGNEQTKLLEEVDFTINIKKENSNYLLTADLATPDGEIILNDIFNFSGGLTEATEALNLSLDNFVDLIINNLQKKARCTECEHGRI